MRFVDRADAGRRLAQALRSYRDRDPIVLALPRGGLPVAAEIAAALAAPLDVVLVRKIGAPWQPELAMGALVDGEAIAALDVDEVEYFHIELRDHEVILAEGLACESYLDTGNRGAFANGGGATMMHADFALKVWERESCARLVVAGAASAAAGVAVAAAVLAVVVAEILTRPNSSNKCSSARLTTSAPSLV